jgi:Flp pilus assembly pilin Flp
LIARRSQGFAAWRDGAARRHAFRSATEGSVAIEYGLIAALVVVVIIFTLVQVRTNLLSLPFPALIAAFTSASS